MFALHVDAVYNNTKGDYKTLDVNSRNPATGRPPGSDIRTRIDQVRPDAEVRYKAIYAKLEKRYSQNYQYTLSYTFTDADDNAPMAQLPRPVRFFDINWGPSNGERRHAIVASGSILLPWDINVGALWSYRTQLPWSAGAGRDLNGDGFTSDLVPGTTQKLREP